MLHAVLSVLYAPSLAGGEPKRWMVLTTSAQVAESLQSVWAAIRRELQLHHRLGLPFHYPCKAIARVAFRLAQKPDAGGAAGAQWGDVGQLSLAAIAFHAGWKSGSIPRLRLLDPLRLVPSAFGLSHGYSFK